MPTELVERIRLHYYNKIRRKTNEMVERYSDRWSWLDEHGFEHYRCVDGRLSTMIQLSKWERDQIPRFAYDAYLNEYRFYSMYVGEDMISDGPPDCITVMRYDFDKYKVFKKLTDTKPWSKYMKRRKYLTLRELKEVLAEFTALTREIIKTKAEAELNEHHKNYFYPDWMTELLK